MYFYFRKKLLYILSLGLLTASLSCTQARKGNKPSTNDQTSGQTNDQNSGSKRNTTNIAYLNKDNTNTFNFDFTSKENYTVVAPTIEGDTPTGYSIDEASAKALKNMGLQFNEINGYFVPISLDLLKLGSVSATVSVKNNTIPISTQVNINFKVLKCPNNPAEANPNVWSIPENAVKSKDQNFFVAFWDFHQDPVTFQNLGTSRIECHYTQPLTQIKRDFQTAVPPTKGRWTDYPGSGHFKGCGPAPDSKTADDCPFE